MAELFAESPGASAWSPDQLAGYLCLVVLDHDAIVGAAVARQVVNGEAELLNLAVADAFRRRGLAGALIRQLLLFFPGEWFLEVRESNRAAIQLYDSMGFTVVSKRNAYYPDSGEAAIVMRRLAC
jgi:ribosomal-protein-alanine acetyltransferase